MSNGVLHMHHSPNAVHLRTPLNSDSQISAMVCAGVFFLIGSALRWLAGGSLSDAAFRFLPDSMIQSSHG